MTLYTYGLAKILQNGAKFIEKTDSWFKKLYMRNLDNFREAVDGPNSWKRMGYFCPKNKFLQLKHYIQRVSNITFNYLCEISPNDWCLFWNHKSFFTTQPLYICSAQTLHTFYKSNLSKWKFSDLPLLVFTKFFMSFSEPRVVFLQNLHHS